MAIGETSHTFQAMMNTSYLNYRWVLVFAGLWIAGCAPTSLMQLSETSQQTSVAPLAPSDRPDATIIITSESAALTTTILETPDTPQSNDATSTTPAPTRSSTPELTLTPTITPTRISVPTEDVVSTEYAVAWSIPVGWPEVSEQVQPAGQTLYHRVWASRVDGAAIFSESPPDFADGLVFLTLEIEPEGATPFPPPNSTPQETQWGQRRVVHAYERAGPEATPFTLRLGLAVLRSPYRFNFMLDCLISPGGDVAYQEALCRDVWDKVTFPFGLCARPSALPSESWQQVSDAYYGYAIEVPGDWLVMPGVTGDQLTLFSDPEGYNTPHACPRPNGSMKIDFSAGTGQDYSPTQDGSGPVLEGYTATQVGDLPVWISKVRGGESAAPDMPPQLLSITTYIQGPDFWYGLHLICNPPSDADEAGQAAFHAQCEATLNQILERFQVLSPQ
jgi:hypothetical protein